MVFPARRPPILGSLYTSNSVNKIIMSTGKMGLAREINRSIGQRFFLKISVANYSTSGFRGVYFQRKSFPLGKELKTFGTRSNEFSIKNIPSGLNNVILRNFSSSSKRSEASKENSEENVRENLKEVTKNVKENAKNETTSKKTIKQSFRKSLIGRIIYKTSLFIGIAITSLIGLVVVFFIYDYTTYSTGEALSNSECKVIDAALYPKKGGPKNLPIVDFLLSEYDSPEYAECLAKPRLVVLGCGWGGVSMLKNLKPSEYHVTVISPTNYFLFTPMLPSATVGTLSLRSLVEPVRKILSRIYGHFLEAEAVKVEFSDKLVEVHKKNVDGSISAFYVPYDKLVIATGTISNTHGVEGLQYCHKLKTVEDAIKIRRKIVENIERASLPSTTEEERKKLLSFVVCGGGPTGVEFAAEIYDFLNEDLIKNYPKILRQHVSVHIVQSRSHILNTYDEKISEYAMERFRNDHIDLLTNSRVERILPDSVQFKQKDENGNIVHKEIPFGLCLWSTGVGMNGLTSSVVNDLTAQTNKRAIETDSHLRVIGAPLGDVYAIGDCATVKTNVTESIIAFLKTNAERAGRKAEDISLSFDEWRQIATTVRRKFPQANESLKKLDNLFQTYDKDKSGTLEFDELKELLQSIDKKTVSLPATAQRANQQGIYLANKLNKLASSSLGLSKNDIFDGDVDNAVYPAFYYNHLGSLAYIGNAAVFDLNGHSFFGGIVAVYLWRSVYFAESVSFRTRALLFIDWLTRGLFGRDILEI